MDVFVFKTLFFLSKVMYDSFSEDTYMNDLDDNRLDGSLTPLFTTDLKHSA